MSSRDTLRQRAVLDAVRALRHVAEQQHAAVLGEYQAHAAWLRRAIHRYATRLPERPYSQWEATVGRSTRDASSPTRDTEALLFSSSVKLPVQKSTKVNSSAVDPSCSTSHPTDTEIHHLAPPADGAPETWSGASLLGGYCNSASSVCGSEHDSQQRHRQTTRVWDPRHSLLGLVQPPAASRKSLMLGARARRRRRLTALHERKPRPSMFLTQAPSREPCAEQPVDATASVLSAIPAQPQVSTDIFAFNEDEANESARTAVRSRSREAEGVSAAAPEAAQTPRPSALPASPGRQPNSRAQHRSIRSRKASRTASTRASRAPPTHRERHSATSKASAKTSSETSVLQNFGSHAETIASPGSPLALEQSASTKQRSPTDLKGSARRTADQASADQFEKPRLSRLSKSHSCGKSQPLDLSECPSGTRRRQQPRRSRVPLAPAHGAASATPRASGTPRQRPNNAAHRARLLALELLSPFSRAKAEQRTPRKDETYCRRCKGMNDPHLMLLCDRCDDCFHTYCCEPPIDSVPDDDWYCEQCVDLDRRPAATNGKPNTSRVTPATNQMTSASPPSKPCQDQQSRRTKPTRRQAGALARRNVPEMRATQPTANNPEQETAVRRRANRTRQKDLRIPRAQREANAPPTATSRAHLHRSDSEAARRSQSPERVPIEFMQPRTFHDASIGTRKRREQGGTSEAVNGPVSDRVAPSHQISLAESFGLVSSAQMSPFAERNDHGQPSSPPSQPEWVDAVVQQRSQRAPVGERQTPTRQSEEAESPALEIVRKGPQSSRHSMQSPSTLVRSRDAAYSIAIPSIVPGAKPCSQEPVIGQSDPGLTSTASPLAASTSRQCANDHLLDTSHAETGGVYSTPLGPVSQARTTWSSLSRRYRSQGSQDGYPSRESSRLSVLICPGPQQRDAPRPEHHRLGHLRQQRLSSSMEPDAIVSVATATAPTRPADLAGPGAPPTDTHPDAMICVSFDHRENLSAGPGTEKLAATTTAREHSGGMAPADESGTTQTPFTDAKTSTVGHGESSVSPTSASILRREKFVLERNGESPSLKADDLSTLLESPNVGNASPAPPATSLTRSEQALEECDPGQDRDDAYSSQMCTEDAKRNAETGIPSPPRSVGHASCDGDTSMLLSAAPINASSEPDDGDAIPVSGDAASSAGVGSVCLPCEPRMVDGTSAAASRSDEHHLAEWADSVQTGAPARVHSHERLLYKPPLSEDCGLVTSTQRGAVDAAGETPTSSNASADRIDADTNRALVQAIFSTSDRLSNAPEFASGDIAPVLVDAIVDLDNQERRCASIQHLVGDGSHALVTCDQMLSVSHSTSERESFAMRSSPTERDPTPFPRPVSGTPARSAATAATSLTPQEAPQTLPFTAPNQLTPSPSQVSAACREQTFLGCDRSGRALAAVSRSDEASLHRCIQTDTVPSCSESSALTHREMVAASPPTETSLAERTEKASSADGTAARRASSPRPFDPVSSEPSPGPSREELRSPVSARLPIADTSNAGKIDAVHSPQSTARPTEQAVAHMVAGAPISSPSTPISTNVDLQSVSAPFVPDERGGNRSLGRSLPDTKRPPPKSSTMIATFADRRNAEILVSSRASSPERRTRSADDSVHQAQQVPVCDSDRTLTVSDAQRSVPALVTCASASDRDARTDAAVRVHTSDSVAAEDEQRIVAPLVRSSSRTSIHDDHDARPNVLVEPRAAHSSRSSAAMATSTLGAILATQTSSPESQVQVPAARREASYDTMGALHDTRSPWNRACDRSLPIVDPFGASAAIEPACVLASRDRALQRVANAAPSKLSRTEELRTRIEKLRAKRVGAHQSHGATTSATERVSTEQVSSAVPHQYGYSTQNDTSEALATPQQPIGVRRDQERTAKEDLSESCALMASRSPSRLPARSSPIQVTAHSGAYAASRPSPNKAWAGRDPAARSHQQSQWIPLTSHERVPTRSEATPPAPKSSDSARAHHRSTRGVTASTLERPDTRAVQPRDHSASVRPKSPTRPLLDLNANPASWTPFIGSESATEAQRRRDEKRQRILEHQRRLALEAERQQARLEPLRRQNAGATTPVPDAMSSADTATRADAGYPLTPERRAAQDVSDDDSAAVPAAKRHLIPEWARSHRLYGALVEQTQVDPDTIFPRVLTCDLMEIFGGANRPRYRRRTSSGDWVLDRLTWREEAAYRRALGFDH